MRKALLSRSESLVTTLTEKLMTYGLARGLEPSDMPSVRKVVSDSAKNKYRFSDIVLGIVNSQSFLLRTAVGTGPKIASLEDRKP